MIWIRKAILSNLILEATYTTDDRTRLTSPTVRLSAMLQRSKPLPMFVSVDADACANS